MLICIVARNCSWIGLGLMFETLLLAWQHMLSQRNAYATYQTMFTSYFSMRVPDTRCTDSCSSAAFSHYLVDVLRAHLPTLATLLFLSPGITTSYTSGGRTSQYDLHSVTISWSPLPQTASSIQSANVGEPLLSYRKNNRWMFVPSTASRALSFTTDGLY